MSQSSSPRCGASALKVSARVSRLVIWPSCSKYSSGRPGERGRTREPRPATTSSAIVFRSAISAISKRSATQVRRRSFAPPIASQTVRTERPMPRSTSACASARGVAPSQERANIFALGCKCGMIAASARPCSESVAQSCRLQPSRAAASENADGAGRQKISSGSKWRRSNVPTPNQKGSPLARTQVGSPRRASSAGIASSIGEGQRNVGAEIGAASARCRAPPTTSVARASRSRAAEESPSRPSSPMPTSESQARSPVTPLLPLRVRGGAQQFAGRRLSRHCEEPLRRSNPGATACAAPAAPSVVLRPLGCFASLAMTDGELAHFSRGFA